MVSKMVSFHSQRYNFSSKSSIFALCNSIFFVSHLRNDILKRGKMKVYFAGSIRGGRTDAELYGRIISYIKKTDIVLTEHIGSKDLVGMCTVC